MSSSLCLVPYQEKVEILESSIQCLADAARALKYSRGTINLLLCELSDLDARTSETMEQIKEFICSFEDEVCPVLFYRPLAGLQYTGTDDWAVTIVIAEHSYRTNLTAAAMELAYLKGSGRRPITVARETTLLMATIIYLDNLT